LGVVLVGVGGVWIVVGVGVDFELVLFVGVL